MQTHRTIATVLFIDIVGSTGRAAEMGDRSWRVLLESFRALTETNLRRFGHREVVWAGDGFFATFDGPAEAIECAVAIRQSTHEIDLEIRSGLHMGQVERSAGHVSGITVHIGSRVASEAQPGEILVSGTVRDAEVGTGFGFEDRGRRQLRGVPGEWRLYAMTSAPKTSFVATAARRWLPSRRAIGMAAAGVALAALLGVYAIRRAPYLGGSSATEAASVAVLPFTDIGGDSQSEYFSDGITEDIRAHLSKLGELKVIGRASVEPYRSTTKSLSEIGSELQVRTILDGSVRRSGDRIRIVTELLEAESGRQLWAETYDRGLEDVFAVQSDVAEKIAVALRATLSQDEIRRIRSRPTADIEAYTLYLKGRYFWNTRTREGINRSIDYFSQAIAADSSYARAYAGLADAYDILGQWYEPPAEAFPKARAAALQALEIDETLAEPRVALGYIAMEYEWDWAAAEQWLSQAVRLDPGYSSGHQYYGNFLRIMGRFDEAIAQGKAALDVDPLSVPQQAELGYTYYYARRYPEAIEQLTHTIEMDSTYAHAHLRMGQVLEQQGRFEAAVHEMELAVSLSGGDSGLQAAQAHALALAGRREEAELILGDLLKERGTDFVSPYSVATVYTALGDHDAAFLWLEEAYRTRSPSMVSLSVHPWLDPLRADPRFTALLKKLRLT